MKWGHVIIFSFLLLVIAFWNRNDLASEPHLLSALEEEPVQKKVNKNAFDVSVNDVDYKVKPLYDYDLHGLVVSYQLHDGNTRLHKLWNDHLNAADYCVVWGDTAKASTLNKIKFWNGQFTCNFSTRNNEAWSNFDPSQLSNNHLVAADKLLRKQISSIRIGDQIRIKGYLAEYTNLNTKGTRGTSINRTDTGNGACETIYVSEINILRAYTSTWRKIMLASLFVLLVSLVLYFKAPVRYQD